MTKFVLPKIKVKPFAVLMAVLAVVVLAEIFILYKYLYLSLSVRRGDADQALEPPRTRIDLPAYEKMKTWAGDTSAYPGPGYRFESSAQGRINPFAEY